MTRPLRVGLVQARTPADQDAALQHIEPLIRDAAAMGAQLIVTPEASNLIEQRRDKRAGKIVPLEKDAAVAGFSNLAAELKTWIVMGSAIVATGDASDPRAANRQIVFDDLGRIVATYDKLHVYDVDLPTGERHRESESIRPGQRAVVAETPFGGIGLSICYDVRFPHLFRSLARAGASLITVPAAFTVPTGQAHWEVLLRARAIETGAFILAAAQGGLHEDGRRTYGHSMVIGPWGEIVTAATGDTPGVLIADLDLDLVGQARSAVAQLQHDRTFEGP